MRRMYLPWRCLRKKQIVEETAEHMEELIGKMNL